MRNIHIATKSRIGDIITTIDRIETVTMTETSIGQSAEEEIVTMVNV